MINLPGLFDKIPQINVWDSSIARALGSRLKGLEFN